MTLIKDHANVIDTPNLPFTSNKRVVSEPYIKFLKRPKKFWPSFNQLVESEALIFQLVVAKLAQITF